MSHGHGWHDRRPSPGYHPNAYEPRSWSFKQDFWMGSRLYAHWERLGNCQRPRPHWWLGRRGSKESCVSRREHLREHSSPPPPRCCTRIGAWSERARTRRVRRPSSGGSSTARRYMGRRLDGRSSQPNASAIMPPSTCAGYANGPDQRLKQGSAAGRDQFVTNSHCGKEKGPMLRAFCLTGAEGGIRACGCCGVPPSSAAWDFVRYFLVFPVRCSCLVLDSV